MVAWECPTNPREASGLDPEAVHDYWDYHEMLARIWWGTFDVFLLGSSVLLLPGGPSLPASAVDSVVASLVGGLPFGNVLAGMILLLSGGWFAWGAYTGRESFRSFTTSRRWWSGWLD